MARPRKDASALVKPKMFNVAKLPLGPDRVFVFRYPLGGLRYAEVQFVKNYINLLQEVDQGDLLDLPQVEE